MISFIKPVIMLLIIMMLGATLFMGVGEWLDYINVRNWAKWLLALPAFSICIYAVQAIAEKMEEDFGSQKEK